MVGLAFVVGVLVGGVLNALIYRIPRDLPLLRHPRCLHCGHRLTGLTAVPVAGFLAQRGRCRWCKGGLPRWFPAVELLTGGCFALAYERFGLTPELGATLFVLMVLIVVLSIDWQHHLIYPVVIYPAAVVTLLLLAIVPGGGPGAALVGGLVAGGFFLATYLLASALYGIDALGFGDVLLAGLIGLMVGFPRVVGVLLLGSLIAGLVGLVLLLSRRKGAREFLPYGTCLCFGAMGAILLPGPLGLLVPLPLIDALSALLGNLLVTLVGGLIHP